MKRSLFTHFAAAAASALLLTACTQSETSRVEFQNGAEQFLRSNISSLSPRAAELGGTFRVSSVQWLDDDTAFVVYEDGHTQYRATVDVRANDDRFVTSNFTLDDDDGSSMSSAMSSSNSFSSTSMSMSSNSSLRSSSSSSSSSSRGGTSASTSMSTSARPRAGLGEFCGGIAGIQCNSGYTCDYDGTYPDAGGVCVR